MDLPTLWILVIAFSLTMYALLDGFDLGVGILMLGRSDAQQRDEMMNSVYPIWDGNETWIVLVGVGLFGGFPLAYSILMPAFYIPLIVMLLSIIFRGVSLEFRFSTQKNQRVWDTCFAVASCLIAFCQGLVLGGLIEGVALNENNEFAGGPWDFFSPFGLLMGGVVVAVYALHGSQWLILKADGHLERQMQRWAQWLLPTAGLLIALATVARHKVPLFYGNQGPYAFQDTFTTPILLALLGVAIGLTIGWVMRRSEGYGPFVGSSVLIAGCAVGVCVALWPNIVPPSITIWEAASRESSQRILLYGSIAVIPVILTYTAYGYYVFRGKSAGRYDTQRTKVEQQRLQNESADASSPPRPLPFPTWGKVGIFVFWLVAFFVIIGPMGSTLALSGLVLLLLSFVALWVWRGNPG